LGPLASLTRVDACNPLLQAHPTWARDEHEGRGISTSLTPVSGRLASSLRARPRARPIWAGARGTLTRRLRDPPVSKRRQIPGYLEFIEYYYRPGRQNTLPHKNLLFSKWEANFLPRQTSLLGFFFGYHL
jgi:hypothetical protein